MTAICSSTQESIAVSSRWQIKLMKPTLASTGSRMQVFICALSSEVERHFAVFANVPYHDPLIRQQWQHLWETEP